MKQLVLGTLVCLLCTSSLAASFDCAKARSASERMVCADPELSASDERLAALVIAGKKRIDALSPMPKPPPAAGAPSPAPAKALTVSAPSPVKPVPVPVPMPVAEAPKKPAPVALPKPVAPPAPAATPVVAAPSTVASAPQFQQAGAKLGFDIPSSKADFLARFSGTGGQCGVSKNLASLKAIARSATSDCWSGTQCPAYSKEINCKVLRTAYDEGGRLVLFMATLNTVSYDSATSTRDMAAVVGKFSAMGGATPVVNKLRSGHMLTLSGKEGALRLDADVMATEGEQQIGMFWVSLR